MIFLSVILLPFLLYILYVFLTLAGVTDSVINFISGKYVVRTVNITGEYGDEFVDEYVFVDAKNDALGGGAYEHTLYFKDQKISTLTTNAENRGKKISLEGLCSDEIYTVYKIENSNLIYRVSNENRFYALKYPVYLNEEIEISKIDIYCHIIKYGDFDLAELLLEKEIYPVQELIESFASGDLSQYKGNLFSEEERNLVINKARQLLE